MNTPKVTGTDRFPRREFLAPTEHSFVGEHQRLIAQLGHVLAKVGNKLFRVTPSVQVAITKEGSRRAKPDLIFIARPENQQVSDKEFAKKRGYEYEDGKIYATTTSRAPIAEC